MESDDDDHGTTVALLAISPSAGVEEEHSDGPISEEARKQAAAKAVLAITNKAATRIQALFRREHARRLVVVRVRQVIDKVFDAGSGTYFYHNRLTGDATWTKPVLLRGETYEPRTEKAAVAIQGLFRKRAAWQRAVRRLDETWERGYDKDSSAWYYIDRKSGESRWSKPHLYGSHEPPVNVTDLTVMEKDKEIERLRRLLEERDRAAKEAEVALENERRQLAIRRGEIDPDDANMRSRHMDEWSKEAVRQWFAEIGFGQYEPQLQAGMVDGLLLLHMAGEDWAHLGIKSALHVRRIEVAMQKYRLRFEEIQAGGDRDGESDNLSDMSASDTPSELLENEEDAQFEAEGNPDDDNDGGGRNGRNDRNGRRNDGRNGGGRNGGEDGDEMALTAEELAEMERDRRNMSKELVFAGDGEERPEPGDVVRVHYTCTTLGGHLVECSRKMRKRPFEFVVGMEQVILGLDRAICGMTFGERARFTISPEYAYGAAGAQPAVPPNATLVFDVNLIQFWPRPRWHKPLIQVAGAYAERPYATVP
ncbi:unnamed protein product, partial [Phaeothamnion confervicola]